MSHDQSPQPRGIYASDFAALAFCVALLLMLMAVVCEATLYKRRHEQVLALAVVVLVSDACLLFAWRHGGTVVFFLATLLGLAALVHTLWVLDYTLQTLF